MVKAWVHPLRHPLKGAELLTALDQVVQLTTPGRVVRLIAPGRVVQLTALGRLALPTG